MTVTDEHAARQIAERGRDALLERLRPAFEDAAAAHSDALQLDSDQLESMVQRAADRADGLQWRRALATVAEQQLGLGLGEALGHPAVARAQEILGVPSYEDSLAELTAGVGGGTKKAREDQRPGEAPEAGEEEPGGGDDERASEAPEAGEEDQAGGGEVLGAPPVPIPLSRTIRLPAIHLGGIANLAPAEANLALRFSDHGFQIFRGKDDAALGRIALEEISTLETPALRGRRRRRQGNAQLVIRTKQGDASFEIPGVSTDELRARLAPMQERLGK